MPDRSRNVLGSGYGVTGGMREKHWFLKGGRKWLKEECVTYAA